LNPRPAETPAEGAPAEAAEGEGKWGAGCGRRREGWEEKMERTTDHEKCDIMGIEYDEIWYFKMERTCSSDTIWYNDVIVNSEML
jgi:hypothetical protein